MGKRLLVSLLAGSSALVSGLAVPSVGFQSPLGVDTRPQKDYRPWDEPPANEDANNLMFFRLATLMQHWPNTRYPSGQSVVPGTVPIGTTLYHGRSSDQLPAQPDWLAFDAEHSIMFARGADSRLFTFVATRPLRVLYFDGSSAAKLSSGAMDTQDFLAWGKAGTGPMGDERRRIVDLCEWGKEFGIDGYVRMEMSFEIMHCDFSNGLEVVSSVHILPTEGGNGPRGGPPGGGTPPGPGKPPNPDDPNAPPPPPPHFRPFSEASPPVPPPFPTQTGSPRRPHFPPNEPRPPNWKGALPAGEDRGFEAFQAGAWHNRAPGEVRVRMDAAKLVSLYDPALGSGAETREGLEKVQHRGKGLSEEDISTWRGWIKDVVQPDAPTTSGVDWPGLTTVIMDRYGFRLEYLQMLLQPDRVSQNVTAAMQDVRSHVMLMLLPDLTADTVPPSSTVASTAAPAQYSQARRRETQNHTWVAPIATHCSSFLLSHLPQDRFTREEQTLYGAVSGTQAEICRVLSLLWAEVYDPLPSMPFDVLLKDWRERVDSLIAWLDWPMWNRCRPECSLDTMCFIPTWPMGIGRGGEEDLSKIDWTPKCIPRKRAFTM